MMKSKLGLGTMIAAAGLAMSAATNTVYANGARHTSSKVRKAQNSGENTHEIEVWNAAIDKQKAEKKAAKRAKRALTDKDFT